MPASSSSRPGVRHAPGVASLRVLALRAARNPGVGSLPAFHARTILAAGADRLGLILDDGVEGPGPLRAFHFHLMLCRYHTAGFRRWPEAMLPVRALWLTSTELGRRYRDAPAARGAVGSPCLCVVRSGSARARP